MSTQSNHRLIRVQEVMNRTAMSRSMIYEKMRAGEFPRNHKIGRRAAAWHEADIDRWIADQIGKGGAE